MAQYESNINNTYKLSLTITPGNYSIADNSTPVSYTLKLISTSKGFSTGHATGYLNINGSRMWTSPSSFSFYPDGGSNTATLASGTTTITHTSDGSKTIAIAANFNAPSYGWGPSNLNISENLTLPKIPRNPNKPGVSITSITKNSFTINWTSNMTIKEASYRIRVVGGSWSGWTNSSVSTKTSGSISVAGRSPGTSYEVQVDVRSSVSDLWTGSNFGSATVSTLHESILTSSSLTPVSGYADRLHLAFTTSSTGGTTTVQYQPPGSSTWYNTSGGQVAGLSPNTNYTVNLRVVNNSGVSNSYTVSGETHPDILNATFSLSQQDKTKITITSSGSNYTSTEYRLNSGEWTAYTSPLTLTGRTPGSTDRVNVRFKNSSTGIVRELGEKLISLPENVFPSISLTDIKRNEAKISLTVSGASSVQYRYKLLNGSFGTWTTITANSPTRFPSSGDLVSSSIYNIEARAVDSQSGQYGKVVEANLTTSQFKAPTITITPYLTYAKVVITPSTDTAILSFPASNSLKIFSGSVVSTATTAVQTFYISSFTSAQFINNVVGLEASTNYSVSIAVQDPYGSAAATISNLSFRTLNLPSGRITLPTNPVIRSLTGEFITVSKPANSFFKASLGAYNISSGNRISSNYTFNATDTAEAIRNSFQGITILSTSLEYCETFSSKNIISATEISSSHEISLAKSLINMSEIGLTYNYQTTSEYGGDSKIKLSGWANNNINKLILNISSLNKAEVAGVKISRIEIIADNTYSMAVASGSTSREFDLGTRLSTPPNRLIVRLINEVGLSNESTYTHPVITYNPPTLSIDSVNRKGGFSSDLEINQIKGNTTAVLLKAGVANKPDRLLIEYRESGGNYTVYNNAKTFLPTNVSNSFVLDLLLDDTTKPTTGTNAGFKFLESKIYKLRVSLIDTFAVLTLNNKFVPSVELDITMGKPILYMDPDLSNVGVGTVNPRGQFEVDEDAYIEKVFSLNGLYFKELKDI